MRIERLSMEEIAARYPNLVDREPILCSYAELADIAQWMDAIELSNTQFCGWSDCRGGHYWQVDGTAERIEPNEATRYCCGPSTSGSSGSTVTTA